jgi:hypothetical protein
VSTRSRATSAAENEKVAMAATLPFLTSRSSVPDLDQGLTASGGSRPAAQTEGSISLFIDDDVIRVVLHGSIGHDVHQDVRDLVGDLVSNVAATAHRPVEVVAASVTDFGLQGVWLLLELRRAARPAAVRVVEPSPALLQALELHGLTSLLPAGQGPAHDGVALEA